MRRIWLISKRLEKGYKQYELANKLGISNQTLGHIELGKRTPNGELAYKIAKELDFDMELFFNGETA